MKHNATMPSSRNLARIQHQLLKDKPAAVDLSTRRKVYLLAALRRMEMSAKAVPSEPIALCELISYILEEA